MNANDKKILALKKQIADKKSLLSGSEKFSPLTNCSLEIDGVRHNLHVLAADQLLFLHVKLNAYLISATALGVQDNLVIGGYKLESWITDIQARMINLNRKQEQDKLKAMEARLQSLLTTDTRASIEIDEIASQI